MMEHNPEHPAAADLRTAIQEMSDPLIGARITVTARNDHPSDSREMDFKIAGLFAVRDGIKKAGVIRVTAQ